MWARCYRRGDTEATPSRHTTGAIGAAARYIAQTKRYGWKIPFLHNRDRSGKSSPHVERFPPDVFKGGLAAPGNAATAAARCLSVMGNPDLLIPIFPSSSFLLRIQVRSASVSRHNLASSLAAILLATRGHTRRSRDGSPPGTSLKESGRIRSVGSLRKGWDVPTGRRFTGRRRGRPQTLRSCMFPWFHAAAPKTSRVSERIRSLPCGD